LPDKSLGVLFPAACSEFVIPAKAGIQKTRLDSPASSAGQAKSSTEWRQRRKGDTPLLAAG